MKILINAFSARRGGGQTYLINLLEHFPGNAGLEVFLLVPDSLELPVGNSNIHRLTVDAPVENPLYRAVWERTELPGMIRELDIDVLFCPGGLLPPKVPRGCRSVTMFRNMIPFDPVQRKRYPLGYMRLRNWLLHRLMLKSMITADLVIFISKYAESVIQHLAKGKIRNSVVIPHGIGPQFRAENITDGKPEWLPDGEYLLYVSPLDIYKAQLEVVRGFSLLKERMAISEKLVLVGYDGNPYANEVRDEVAALGLEGDVIVTGAVPYRQLPAAYRHAKVNIFASECENCPNILLEALSSGRPVICSDRQPMPEFGGDAPLYFDPQSPESFADMLGEVLGNPGRQQSMAEAAYRRSGQFDWAHSAEATWQVLAQTGGDILQKNSSASR